MCNIRQNLRNLGQFLKKYTQILEKIRQKKALQHSILSITDPLKLVLCNSCQYLHGMKKTWLGSHYITGHKPNILPLL
jgi:hypothetical protein